MSSLIAKDRAAEHNFTRYELDTIIEKFTLEEKNVGPIDLTGASVVMRCNSQDLAATITSAAEGKVEFDFTGWVPALPVGSYDYEIRITFSSGQLWTHTAGNLKIKANVG